MGAPKPWPTRWPEPERVPHRVPYYEEDEYFKEPFEDPDYEIEVDPGEIPFRLPEDLLVAYSATWGITHSCNLRCDHCYDATGYRRTDLPTEKAIKVVDRLAETGISFLAFSGGEPMLRRDLYQIMEYCRVKGMDIAMRSNSTLITREKARRLAELDMQVVGVSLDGATEVSHDQVRGQGMYRKMRDGIDALLTEGIRVNLEVVLRKRNVHQALQFIALTEDWGVDEVNFAAIVPQGRASQLRDEMLSNSEWEKVTAQLCQASKSAKIAVSPSCTLLGACWACVEPDITCDGWVTPCYLSKHRLFHILETDPVQAKANLQRHRLGTMNSCGRLQSAHAINTQLIPWQMALGGQHPAIVLAENRHPLDDRLSGNKHPIGRPC